MERRGHPRSESGHNSHRPKDREDYFRYSHQDKVQCYPPADPRERDRSWGHPDPRYRSQLTSPPRADPYGPQHHPYGYGWPEQQRPQSRHGYDYSAYSHWDYRENYNYYEQDYYRGQRGHQDGGQWPQQESWIVDHYQDNSYKQDPSRSTENRFEQRRESSQQRKDDYEESTSKEIGEGSSYYLGTLERSKNSGLSSSSYELSLYINGADQSGAAPQSVHTTYTEHNHQTSAPLKYTIPHAVVSFGPAGQLLRVSPGFSAQKNVSQLEIHSLEVILSETQEQQEMRKFPGPLTREELHKVDAIEFAHQRAGACLRDDRLHDQSSAALLWNLLILLCRQNGQIVGSDIAELLVQGSRSNVGSHSESASLIDFSEGTTAEAPPHEGEDDLLTGNSFSSESAQKALRSYTQLLLGGRKKEALESAMSSGLWGHALFLASRMDNRAYTTVLNRFTGQLAANDTLQTLFQLLSGRIPAVATCCGSEKWGDWRPHLAMILSNETGEPAVKQKAIATMGDTLASRGLVHSAHVCYLTAGVPFGAFTQKDERLVLLGSSHRQAFGDFATNSAIHCTELYEYCQNLGGNYFSIPSFQVFKFLYASRLLDCGLASQAFHYCEVVGQAILRQDKPLFVLTHELLKLSDRLRHSEGQYSDTGLSGADEEPGWITQLRFRHHRLQTGSSGSFSETHKPPDRSAVFSDDHSTLQSPEPELLYYRVTEEISLNPEVASPDGRAVSDWPEVVSPMPAPGIYAPPVPVVAAGQGLTYHNTSSAGVGGAVTHCPIPNPSAAEEFGLKSGLSTTGNEMMAVGQMQMRRNMRQDPALEGERSEHGNAPKQSGGWFSGWFKSKPKDVQQGISGQSTPLQTFPATDLCPPPPALSSPAMFPPPPTSTSINRFSRKAGQQLR